MCKCVTKNLTIIIFYNTSQSKSSMSVFIMYVEDKVNDNKSLTVTESTTWPIT